jgi:NitT/TauT family transport system ATP-binding protein
MVGSELMSSDVGSPASQAYIDVSDVRVIYHSTTGEDLEALQRVDLQVDRGTFCSIVGASGCGKSTLIMAIAGLLRPTTGTIIIGGQKVSGPYADLGIVFQKDVLLDWRNALGNILLQIDLRGQPRRRYEQRAHELLNMVGLEGMERKFPWELSGGMRQRVAICRALVHDPPLLLMDEPFGALDAITRDQLNLDLMELWQHSRKTVLFVTHSLMEAVFLSDQVLIMSPRPGKVVDVVNIDLPRPRDLSIRETPEFIRYTQHIRTVFEQMGVYRGRSSHNR